MEQIYVVYAQVLGEAFLFADFSNAYAWTEDWDRAGHHHAEANANTRHVKFKSWYSTT